MPVQRDMNNVYADYADDPCEEALTQLMEAGERMIRSLVRSLAQNSIPEDLIQAGYLGLMKAVRCYDPSYGTQFSTFAYQKVMGEVRLEIRKERTFDRPLWLVNLQDSILKATDEFIVAEKRMPTRSELAAKMNIEESGIETAMQAGSVPLDELNLKDLRSISQEAFRLPLEDKIVLQQAINGLSKLQRAVIDGLFYQGKTQEAVGKELNIDRSQVYRAKRKSLRSIAGMLR